jgi:putrescine transport system permease protein
MNKYFFKILSLTIGLGFLYFPILTLIAYSFNDNKRVMVWKGFSFKWYGKLFQNEQIIEAFLISIKIASLSATFATILGVMIGYSLTRISKIPARPFFHIFEFVSIGNARNYLRFIFVAFFYFL